MEGMNFAAIDIGTNAARLLIKNIDHNPLGETKFRKVLFIRYPLRLGMDVFSKGKIGKERAEMMMHMIKGFKQIDRKSTRLNSSHSQQSRMPTSA